MFYHALWGFMGLALFLLSGVQARPLNDPLLDVYDYIVVGGGVSGLTVANRLTEDPSVTVLVIEAGQADNYNEDVMVPVFVGANIYSSYDWYFQTAPQTYLDGAMRRIPQGRALGGGSIINAMLWNRGGQDDYNDWQALGNPGWGWDGMLPYFMRSETFTPLDNPQTEETQGISYNPAVHGYSGPVNVSYQGYFYNTSANFFEGLNYLGMPTVFDPNEASAAGATYLPLDIDPKNMSRADARISYYDPYAGRPNFWVSTGQYVTQIVFEDAGTCANNNTGPRPGDPSTGQGTGQGQPPVNGPAGNNQGLSGPPPSKRSSWKPSFRPFFKRQNGTASATPTNSSKLRAIGVEFAADAAAPRSTVLARREVILAAGALQSPKVLELSGIGSRSVLDAFNITTLVDLPGVGENLQDHQLVGTYYQYYNNSFTYSNQLAQNGTLNQLAMQEYYANRTGPWTAGPADGNAFPSLAQISEHAGAIVAHARRQNPLQHLRQGLDSTVVAGFEAQFPLIVDALNDPDRAVIELLNSNAGNLSPSNMRPFSRGTTHIAASDAFVPPMIDPRYGSNPIDVAVLYEALLFNRLLLQTPSMAQMQPYQWAPPANANRSELHTFIANSIGTEYHPSGTCAMMPLQLGGVVDPSLLVYGTQNVRVVDASIQPILPASHLQAICYGVGEKAADIIKAANVGPAPPDPSLPAIGSGSCSSVSASASASLPYYANSSSTYAWHAAQATSAAVFDRDDLESLPDSSSSAPDSSLATPSVVATPTVDVSITTTPHPTVAFNMATKTSDTYVPDDIAHGTTAMVPPAPGPFAGYLPLAPVPATGQDYVYRVRPTARPAHGQ